MNDEEPIQETLDPQAEIATEEPVGQPDPKKWSMPDPVFQQTSGYLPQGYEKLYGTAASAGDGSAAAAGADGNAAPKMQNLPPAVSGNNSAAAAAAGAPAAVDVEPQPDLTEAFDLEADDPAPAEAPAKNESGAIRIVMIALAFAALAGFVALFLAVIYYLFLVPEAGSAGGF